MHLVVAAVVSVLLFSPSVHAASATAMYELTFDATWSAQTHPVSFPPNPHFSGLVGGTHRDTVVFWEPGGLASTGIERMAELGSQSELAAEVGAAISAGDADSTLLGGGISVSPGSVTLQFSIDQSFPQLTLVSMLAPSPDWFVGVHGLTLFDGANWTQSITVPLAVYDAGTDSGPSYTSPNADTVPQDPIALAGGPLAGTPPVGTFTLTRLDSDPPVPVTLPPFVPVVLSLLLAAALTCLRAR